jgi:acetyltransferase
VAIVGASEVPNSFGERSTRYFDRLGYQGRVHCVNPRYARVGDRPCYPSIADIPDQVDAAVITIQKNHIFQALDDLGRKGCRLGVVLTAGFSEAGAEGASLQHELVERAHRNGIRLFGPNTNGIVNITGHVPLGVCSFMERAPFRAGNLALISQSGSLGASLADMAIDAGIGLSYFFAIGNAADVNATSLLRDLAEDQHTEVVYALLEGCDGPEFFAAVGKLVSSGKKLILSKVGKSQQGRSLASTHSGSIAGSWEAFRAIAEDHGAIVAETPELALAACAFASKTKFRSAKPRLQVVTLSGALSGLIADEAAGLGLALTEPVDETVRAGVAELGFTYPLNPLDFGQVPRGEHARHDIGTLCDILLGDPSVDMLLLAAGLTHHFGALTGILNTVRQKHEKPICVYIMGGSIAADFVRTLDDLGIVTFRDLRQAMVGIRLGTMPALGKGLPLAYQPNQATGAAHLLETAAASPTEAAISAFLSAHGMPYPRHKVVRSRDEAVEAAEQIRFPVALKVVGSAILHKSAAGLMRLPLTNRSDLELAFQDCRTKAEAAGVWEGQMIVQELVDTRGGVEILLAIRNDIEAGPIMIVGPGGIAAEALPGAIVIPIPRNTGDIDRLIEKSALLRLLFDRNYRGFDRSSFESALLALAEAAHEGLRRFETIEVNPLVILPNNRGCKALDASGVVSP